MDFKTLSIIKQPPKVVWQTMRDHFPDIARLVDEVESITVKSRDQITYGKMEVVNIWKAAPQLPTVIEQYIKPEMLTWTDTAIWDEEKMVCNWTIDSHYFREKMDCKGITKFEPAIGGRGCRLTFQGNIYWDGSIPITFGVMDGMISKALESIMGKMVPNNFRKLTSAIETYIEMQTA